MSNTEKKLDRGKIQFALVKFTLNSNVIIDAN